MLALSTAWCPRRYSLDKIFRKGRRIGFRAFELGVSDAPVDPDAVADAVQAGRIEITSIHAVCSRRDIAPGNTRGDWIADLDTDRRRAGVAAVRDTVDVARQVGARAVVLHGGVARIPDYAERQFQLYRLVARGAPDDERARRVAALLADRGRVAPACLDALEESLKELCAYAPELELGVENRYFAAEIPLNDEFDELFDRVDAPNLRYWHDVGHAQILERIGVTDHLELLERQSERLAGMHLHDVRGFDDHRPPGTGEFNFAALLGYLRPGVHRVLEIGSRHSARAIKRAKRHLAKVYGID
ncbi:MAG: sugar phosphate isomerase/epimerase family protein [Planctomycetota bacterium]